MAKMFYSLKETAKKLKITESEVIRLARSGQFQDFRDRDRLMFKVEQIDACVDYGDHESAFKKNKAKREAEQAEADPENRKTSRWNAFYEFLRVMVGK